MKQIIRITIAVLFWATLNGTMAQSNPVISQSGFQVDMLFSDGKSKALILSFDDGPIADRRLVKLMNQFGLVGTFHLNSNKLGEKDYLTKEEISGLFKGHEVSVHSANHPPLTKLPKLDVVYEIVEDRRELERLTGYSVRGMAYPFGNFNDQVIDAIRGLGIEYARTVQDTGEFGIPDDFLKWHPTIHQFGGAYFRPNDPANDKRELERFYGVIARFLKADTPALLDVWGHSWENNGEGDRWTEQEKFFKMVANNPDICYTTHIGLVDYVNAFRNLRLSVEKKIVTNLSSVDVFVRAGGKTHKIAAGSTIILK
ncbi:MAG: polysaccharide deacetylase family protein [Acidobacteria bacterium]|nr:polysaccharide deacetylase family protein [Acidobacteriota bacterium]